MNSDDTTEPVDNWVRKWFGGPFKLSLAFTPLALLIGFLSAGAGHGNYALTKLLFPFTMISVVTFNQITLPFFILALLQYPSYGAILSWAAAKGNWFVVILLVFAHFVAAVACFVLIGPEFS